MVLGVAGVCRNHGFLRRSRVGVWTRRALWILDPRVRGDDGGLQGMTSVLGMTGGFGNDGVLRE